MHEHRSKHYCRTLPTCVVPSTATISLPVLGAADGNMALLLSRRPTVAQISCAQTEFLRVSHMDR
jgi:hypothetical protein